MAFKQPLADVMRPVSLEQMVGQKHLVQGARFIRLLRSILQLVYYYGDHLDQGKLL